VTNIWTDKIDLQYEYRDVSSSAMTTCDNLMNTGKKYKHCPAVHESLGENQNLGDSAFETEHFMNIIMSCTHQQAQ